MDGLAKYFISLTAAAVVCGIITALFPGNGTSAKLIKLISGILLTLIALRPVSRLDLDRILTNWEVDLSTGEYASQDGETLARNAMAKIIKDNCEAYILDKASQLGLRVTAEVKLNEDDIPKPVSVCIRGYASPYAKSQLQHLIVNDLGIPKEDQVWTAQP